MINKAEEKEGIENRKRSKHKHHQEYERTKRRAVFGVRSTSKIFDAKVINIYQTALDSVSGRDNHATCSSSKQASRSWKEKIIIDSESKTKAIFDVFVLLLVGYSCITSVYNVAIRSTEQQYALELFDSIVEASFIVDLLLNFIQSYKDPETFQTIVDLKLIARNYVFHGWFLVDMVAVFPFETLLPTGQVTKLFRMFRLPRLIKLIDISRFNKLLKSLATGEGQIQAQFTMLYIYKMLRLVLIAMIITYFIGCFWFYSCNLGQAEETFIKWNEME